MTLSVKTVLTYGTFDMFHVGHLNILKNAKAFGSRLVVGVSSDEFNAVKGKDTLVPYTQRAAIVGEIRYVDQVFAEMTWDQKRDDVRRWSADILVMGADWTGKFDFLRDVCEVIYLPRTNDISTTEMKDLSKKRIRDELEEVMNDVERLTKFVGSILGKFE